MIKEKFSALSERDQIFASLLIIIATVLLFYSNSFTTDWHYDDFHHIKENINIRKMENVPLFFKDPTTFSRNPTSKMYRPLLMTTHAINYQMGLASNRDGYYVVWYHITNFLFHVFTIIAIFFITLFIFNRYLRSEKAPPLVVASFAALFFGLHTINTETVVYVSSRSSGMATMFFLWAFYLYLRATEGLRVRYSLIVLSSLSYACAQFSKEIAITLPIMIFYYELLLDREWREGLPLSQAVMGLFRRIGPYFAVALGYVWLRHIMLHENLVEKLTSTGGTAAAKNLTMQLATQARVWVYYVREWLWPTSLSIDKPFGMSTRFAEPRVLFSFAVIIALLVLAFRIRKKSPIVAFGILWFFTALLPTSLFRLNVIMNDHRLYLPGFGAIIISAFAFCWLLSHFKAISRNRYRAFVSIVCLTILFMGLGTFKRNMAFATEETIWKDVILKDRKSVRGYNNLGIWYEQKGEYEKALAHYQQTIKLAPMFPNPYINIGNVYHKQKKYEPAEKWMKKALQLDPRSALASYNLGNILREAGKSKEAIGAYMKALQLNPRYIEAANNLANIYFKTRNYQEAIKYYEQALFIDPTFAMSYYNIALASENLGRFDDAVENFEKFQRFWLGDPKYLQLAQQKVQALKNKTNQ